MHADTPEISPISANAPPRGPLVMRAAFHFAESPKMGPSCMQTLNYAANTCLHQTIKYSQIPYKISFLHSSRARSKKFNDFA
jgi:hypothetical protein